MVGATDRGHGEAERPIAVITGASAGIGAATAARFQADGWAVVGLDIASRDGPDVAHREDFVLWHCDVSNEADVGGVVDRIRRMFGRVDALINVAGIAIVKPLEEISWAEYRRLVDVNLGGQWLTCKHVVPIMKTQGAGVIVNVASVSGHVGQVAHSLYGATKGAVIAFTRAAALELAPFGIRVVSISPGSVDTAMLREDVQGEAARTGQSYEMLRRERENEQALHRWAQPSEVASLIRYLVSDQATFITGTDVLVDGGWTAK